VRDWRPAWAGCEAGRRAVGGLIPDEPGGGHGFPRLLTPFVGRSQELRLAAGALEQDETRLLTLVRPPGRGKARPAPALAEQVQPAFPDAGWFVDLTGEGPGGFLAAVARGLGRRDRPRNVPIRSWLELRLRGRHMLLVLDPLEHLVAGAGDLADLLAGAPG